jgi:colanic acid/amylovoran biosynthesis glycosyltransferase
MMEIAFMVHSFPNTTGTFIQNQIIGLLDNAHNVSIFSELKPSEDIYHEKIQNYNLKDLTIYTSNPQSYLDGIRLLSTTIPSLLFNNEVGPRIILAQLVSGKTAPRKLANLDTVTQYGSFDVYHVHFGPTANSFLPLAASESNPFIASFYGFDTSKALREDPGRYNKLFDQADAITVLSEDMRSTVVDAGCPEAKTHIQPLSVDTELFPYYERTLDNRPIHLLTVARFVEKKGLVYAIEAVSTLADEYDVQYTIIGDGDRRDLIEAKIAEHNLEDTVELLGWQPQSVVADEMADAHLFMLPSVTAESGDKEGTPTVLLEAQSMGLPVVSTYHAGIPEIVEDGETGILVPERNSEALADALETLLAEPDRWSEMGRRGREHIEQNHAIEAVTDDLLELYRSLM